MKLVRSVFILITLLTQNKGYTQLSNYGSFTETHERVSADNKSYTLKVTLPNNYDKNQSYKVLYYLDSWWLSELVLGSYAIISLSQDVEDIILVGISAKGNQKIWNRERSMDYTPSRYDLEKMGFPITAGRGENSLLLDKNSTGGADSFLDFFENNVLDFVDKKYKNDSTQRGLLGHSLGGLFSFYVLQKKPRLFANYIIISPSIWWNKSELIQKPLFNEFLTKKDSSRIHVSYGEKENGLIRNSNVAMNEMLQEIKNEKTIYRFNAYEKADHHSILSKAIYDGLHFIYVK